jgi:hypothetical protein
VKVNLGWLLEAAPDLICGRCGKPGAAAFTDMAGLERFLSPELRNGFAEVDLARLADFGPVHSRCPRDRPPAASPAYNLLASVR